MSKPYKTVKCPVCKSEKCYVFSGRTHYIRQFTDIKVIPYQYTITVDEIRYLCCGSVEVSIVEDKFVKYKNTESRERLHQTLRNLALTHRHLDMSPVKAYNQLSLERMK